MGVILTPNGTAARAGVEGGAASITDNDPYFKALQAEMADKAAVRDAFFALRAALSTFLAAFVAFLIFSALTKPAAAPPEWDVQLPDLRTRLAASPLARIEGPDDALVAALIERGFERARVDARPELVQWLAARVERSHRSVTEVVDTLAAAALAGHRRLSIPMARETLAAAATFIDRDPDA